ncbi:hypothetical protein AAMO2058_000104700 [Amorphochlora amoebiformis]
MRLSMAAKSKLTVEVQLRRPWQNTITSTRSMSSEIWNVLGDLECPRRFGILDVCFEELNISLASVYASDAALHVYRRILK